MKNIDKELIDWAVKKIQEEYPEDVALLIGMKGACKIPTDEQNMSFDYFVPATEKGNGLAQTFVIEDMGYDLYPISWERMEGIADFHEPRMIFAFDLGEVIYARREEDREHFYNLKTRLQQNLADQKLTFHTALEYLNTAMEIWNTMMFEESDCKIRKAAGGISCYLMNAIAMLNGTYLVSGYGNLTLDIRRMKEMPEGFENLYHKVLMADCSSDLQTICHKMIGVTRDFFLEKKPEGPRTEGEINYEDLAEWYYEARYTFRRIAYYVENGIMEESFLAGCYLQIEFDAIQEEFGLQELNLLGAFHRDGLVRFGEKARELEAYLLQILQENVKNLKLYDSLEDFLER